MSDSNPKSSFQREIYIGGLSGIKPQTTRYENLHDQAKEILSKSELGLPAYWYVQGGASNGKTMKNNRDAFDQYSIVPRMLANVTIENFSSTETTQSTLFGRKISAPLVVCPIGVQKQLHKDADLATATAASELGIPYSESCFVEK